jgi:predicted DNA-binding transcriptional regulator AlpA
LSLLAYSARLIIPTTQRSAPVKTRAAWADDVPDLYGDLKTAATYYSLMQASEETSLSPNTLADTLSRPPVTREDNPMFALSRPAARIGNSPLYSKQQVADAIRIQKTSQHRHLGGGQSPLTVVSPEESRRCEFISIREIATYAGIHEQTVRRWAREQDSFPSPVALRARENLPPGVPIVVYELAEVKAWLRLYVETNQDSRVERIAVHLRKTHGWEIQLGSRVN